MDTVKKMPDNFLNCVVTSPPYFGLRSYCEDAVKLKKDAPQWVIDELESLGIKPVDTNK